MGKYVCLVVFIHAFYDGALMYVVLAIPFRHDKEPDAIRTLMCVSFYCYNAVNLIARSNRPGRDHELRLDLLLEYIVLRYGCCSVAVEGNCGRV